MITLGSGKLSSKITQWGLNRFSKFSWFKKAHEFAFNMDHALANFYRDYKHRFIFSALWHLMGWAGGTIEVMVIVHLLGYAISPLNAFVISSVATFFMVGGFMIPGSLGALELGHYVAASMIGLPPAVGLSICLARRFREGIWLGLGLVFFGIFYKRFFGKNARFGFALFKTHASKEPQLQPSAPPLLN
jgi:hypothetical protein